MDIAGSPEIISRFLKSSDAVHIVEPTQKAYYVSMHAQQIVGAKVHIHDSVFALFGDYEYFDDHQLSGRLYTAKKMAKMIDLNANIPSTMYKEFDIVQALLFVGTFVQCGGTLRRGVSMFLHLENIVDDKCYTFRFRCQLDGQLTVAAIMVSTMETVIEQGDVIVFD